MENKELIEKVVAEVLGGAKDYHNDVRNTVTQAIPIIQKDLIQGIIQYLENKLASP